MSPLHHLALGARDVRNVADFYQAAFQLAPVATHHYPDGRLRSLWLKIGESVLMIEHTEAEPRQVEGVGQGPFLIAFRVTEKERTALETHLESLGATIESRTEASSYARDPEGNRIAISHYQW